MIIEREVHCIPDGRWSDAVQALREEDNATRYVVGDAYQPARVYTSIFGPDEQLAVEWTSASMAERDANWAAWRGTGRAPAFFEKWGAHGGGMVSGEILELISASLLDAGAGGIAVRWTRIPVFGKPLDLIDLWTRWIVDTGKYTARVMRPLFAGHTRAILEMEFADLADYQTQFQAWLDQPGIEAFWETYRQVVRPGGATEVWRLHA